MLFGNNLAEHSPKIDPGRHELLVIVAIVVPFSEKCMAKLELGCLLL